MLILMLIELTLKKVSRNCQHYKVKPIQMNVLLAEARTEKAIAVLFYHLSSSRGTDATAL